MTDAMEATVGRRILLRLVVPSALFILVGAIDRTNVGFAALQMNVALGLSGTQYGFGAGVLFIGYLLAKYPSVLLYERIGMHRWLCAITLAWGMAACLMGAVRNEWELYFLRLFLGFAEGGLSSGLMIYLSQWAVERHRATILSIPIMAISIAQVIGAPVSGWLLEVDNPLGIEGWRFMFLVEGIPALLLGIFAWFHYPDTPEQVTWLDERERNWLAANVRVAERPDRASAASSRWGSVRDPVGWLCAAIWFCILASNYGVMFWLPQIVEGVSGLSPTQVGWIVALPWAGSAIGLYFNARHSDRTQERFLHVAIPAFFGGAGLFAAYLIGPGATGLAMLILGGACTGCTVAAFWAIPTKYLHPRDLAMGIVFINIVGSFAGATIPGLMGYLLEQTGTYFAPTALLFGIATLCSGLCLVTRTLVGRSAQMAIEGATT